MRKKIIPQIDLSDFKITEEAVDAIYLSWEEISKIYKADLSRFPYLIDYRNMFVLGCLTGLRFSDFSTIKLSMSEMECYIRNKASRMAGL